jgi:hypothetical protein
MPGATSSLLRVREGFGLLFDDRFGYFVAVEDDLVPVIGDFLADGVLFTTAGTVSDRRGCFDVASDCWSSPSA